MAQTISKYLPRQLQTAFSRFSGPESLRSLLAMLDGNPAFVTYWDDFIGQSAGTWPASQKWGYPATVGAGTEVISVTTAALGGRLTLVTGGTTDNSAVQTFGLHWRGTEGWYYLCKGKLASLASCKFEVGMTDSITGDQAINVKATPTFVATDAACFIFDTTEDTNLTFITVNAGVVGANVDSTLTMDTNDHWYEIIGKAGQATGFVDGRFVGAGAITSTAPLTPYMASVTRTGSAKTFSVDYQGVTGPRG